MEIASSLFSAAADDEFSLDAILVVGQNLHIPALEDKMEWHKEYLDLILVPSGFAFLLVYHLFLLYRCKRCPQCTVIGFENHSKRTWARKMMQLDMASRSPAYSVIASKIKAATSMASISLAVSSLIGTWVGSSSKPDNFLISFVYGDTSISNDALKYISIIAFFLAAFSCFVQTTRLFVHANFLITMPLASVPIEFLEEAIIRGTYFWHAGLRAIYFATTFLMWVFGPIPMFATSVASVMLLYFLDANTNPLQDFQHHPGKNSKESKKSGEEKTEVVVTQERTEKNEKQRSGTSPRTVTSYQVFKQIGYEEQASTNLNPRNRIHL